MSLELHPRCRWAAALLFAVAAMRPAASGAADAADEWVDRGIDMRRVRRDAEALEFFRRAYEIRPTPRTRVQMALAEQALGRWIEAEADLAEALKLPGDAWIEKNHDKLLEGLETIRAHLGWLRLDSQPGTELWINGARVGTLPLDAVRVVANTVWVELRAPDFEPWQQSIDVRPNETVRVVAPLQPVRAAAPEAPARPVVAPSIPRASPQKTIGWVTLGVGGVLLAEGAVAQMVRAAASSHYNDDNLCLAPGLTRDQLCGNYRGRAETAQTFATIGWIGGGAAVGVGLVLLLTSRSEPPHALVHMGPQGAGVSWWTSF
jgi:hypothetical protein